MAYQATNDVRAESRLERADFGGQGSVTCDLLHQDRCGVARAEVHFALGPIRRHQRNECPEQPVIEPNGEKAGSRRAELLKSLKITELPLQLKAYTGQWYQAVLTRAEPSQPSSGLFGTSEPMPNEATDMKAAIAILPTRNILGGQAAADNSPAVLRPTRQILRFAPREAVSVAQQREQFPYSSVVFKDNRSLWQKYDSTQREADIARCHHGRSGFPGLALMRLLYRKGLGSSLSG